MYGDDTARSRRLRRPCKSPSNDVTFKLKLTCQATGKKSASNQWLVCVRLLTVVHNVRDRNPNLF